MYLQKKTKEGIINNNFIMKMENRYSRLADHMVCKLGDDGVEYFCLEESLSNFISDDKIDKFHDICNKWIYRRKNDRVVQDLVDKWYCHYEGCHELEMTFGDDDQRYSLGRIGYQDWLTYRAWHDEYYMDDENFPIFVYFAKKGIL